MDPTAELIQTLALLLDNTPLANKSVNLTQFRARFEPIVNQVLARLKTSNQGAIIGFLTNQHLLKECIIPNVVKILNDNRLALDDAPYFIAILTGVFTEVNQLVGTQLTVSLSSEDIIELVGLILKVVFGLVIRDQMQSDACIILVDSLMGLTKLTIKPRKCSCLVSFHRPKA
jgi:hypothetical protein